MDDDFDDDMDDELEMFVEAQDTVWGAVTAELQAGRKTTHWIWFVFPQLASLGSSHMAQLYGLSDLDEAKAYLAHPVLRERLENATTLVLSHAGSVDAEILMGGATDALKLQSSMTLFAAVPDAPPKFADVLAAFFQGQPCAQTTAELAG